MPKKMDGTPLKAKFFRNVLVSGTSDCLQWVGGLNGDGYGNFYYRRRTVGAHRTSYELLVGPIPAGLELDHLCRNRACVNPDHLEPVTGAENKRRALGAADGACPNGHPYLPTTTYIAPNGTRKCRPCNRATVAKYKARKKQATAAVMGEPR